MQLDLCHLIAFALGFIASVSKDYLQQKIFVKHMSKLGQEESDKELERIMNAGFGLNDRPPDDDSSNIENNYKSYFS